MQCRDYYGILKEGEGKVVVGEGNATPTIRTSITHTGISQFMYLSPLHSMPKQYVFEHQEQKIRLQIRFNAF